MQSAVNAIEVKGLTKDYGDFKLDNVDLALPEGYIMGIIGENGAGKTTLIKAMLNIIKYRKGKVTLLGSEMDGGQRDIKEHIGAVLDECCFPEEMNAVDVGRFMSRIYETWNSEDFRSYCGRFLLSEKKKIKEYSKGMKMKLSIAAALSHDSRLLILDEATSGLDPVVRDEMLEIFREFIQEENRSVLISSHILSDLEKICDYITFMHRGKIIFSENKDILLEKYGIAKVSKEAFDEMGRESVIAYRENRFGIEALVKREKLREGIPVDQATIEDIMVYYIKEAGK